MGEGDVEGGTVGVTALQVRVKPRVEGSGVSEGLRFERLDWGSGGHISSVDEARENRLPARFYWTRLARLTFRTRSMGNLPPGG